MKDNKPIIYVGICARESGKRSGKDAFADFCINYISAFTSHPYAKIALADSLKQAVGSIFGLSNEQMYGCASQKESITSWMWPIGNKYGREGPMTAREILQYFGTEIMRDNFCHDIWIKSLEIQAEAAFERSRKCNQMKPFEWEQPAYVFVPDVRYPNEADKMDLLVDIYRPEAKRNNVDVHVSELSGSCIAQEKIGFTVMNDGTLDDLQSKAVAFCTDILLNF